MTCHIGKNDDITQILWRESERTQIYGERERERLSFMGMKGGLQISFKSEMKLYWESLSFIFTHSSIFISHLDKSFKFYSNMWNRKIKFALRVLVPFINSILSRWLVTLRNHVMKHCTKNCIRWTGWGGLPWRIKLN